MSKSLKGGYLVNSSDCFDVSFPWLDWGIDILDFEKFDFLAHERYLDDFFFTLKKKAQKRSKGGIFQVFKFYQLSRCFITNQFIPRSIRGCWIHWKQLKPFLKCFFSLNRVLKLESMHGNDRITEICQKYTNFSKFRLNPFSLDLEVCIVF